MQVVGTETVLHPDGGIRSPAVRYVAFRKQALDHHVEQCLGLEIGVKMAMLIEEEFGSIQSPDLKVRVKGAACLADVLKGLTRAWLVNPARFVYSGSAEYTEAACTRGTKTLYITVRPGVDIVQAATRPAYELFHLKVLYS